MPLHKPGDIITPTSFAVAPELLGRPLAKPSRRAAAMAIDLVLLAILVNAGAVFFGIAAAVAVWSATARTAFASSRPRLRRLLRIGSAIILFVIVVSNWGLWMHPLRHLLTGSGSGSTAAVQIEHTGSGEPHIAINGLAPVMNILALRRATDSADARAHADELVQRLRAAGASDADLQQVESSLQRGSESERALPPLALNALQQAIAAVTTADGTLPASEHVLPPDSLARAYLAALGHGDSDAVARLRPRLGVSFAADTLAALDTRLLQLSDENQRLRQRVQQDSTRLASSAVGLMDTVANASGELIRLLRKAGLGFGWLGLYFTGFVALMRGQTPGKRIMHIRIVRLDGKPMNWWASLERFGGYAASVVTALGGFFEILWDRNRQAMHDKIAETVVIRV